MFSIFSDLISNIEWKQKKLQGIFTTADAKQSISTSERETISTFVNEHLTLSHIQDFFKDPQEILHSQLSYKAYRWFLEIVVRIHFRHLQSASLNEKELTDFTQFINALCEDEIPVDLVVALIKYAHLFRDNRDVNAQTLTHLRHFNLLYMVDKMRACAFVPDHEVIVAAIVHFLQHNTQWDQQFLAETGRVFSYYPDFPIVDAVLVQLEHQPALLSLVWSWPQLTRLRMSFKSSESSANFSEIPSSQAPLTVEVEPTEESKPTRSQIKRQRRLEQERAVRAEAEDQAKADAEIKAQAQVQTEAEAAAKKDAEERQIIQQQAQTALQERWKNAAKNGYARTMKQCLTEKVDPSILIDGTHNALHYTLIHIEPSRQYEIILLLAKTEIINTPLGDKTPLDLLFSQPANPWRGPSGLLLWRKGAKLFGDKPDLVNDFEILFKMFGDPLFNPWMDEILEKLELTALSEDEEFQYNRKVVIPTSEEETSEHLRLLKNMLTQGMVDKVEALLAKDQIHMVMDLFTMHLPDFVTTPNQKGQLLILIVLKHALKKREWRVLRALHTAYASTWADALQQESIDGKRRYSAQQYARDFLRFNHDPEVAAALKELNITIAPVAAGAASTEPARTGTFVQKRQEILATLNRATQPSDDHVRKALADLMQLNTNVPNTLRHLFKGLYNALVTQNESEITGYLRILALIPELPQVKTLNNFFLLPTEIQAQETLFGLTMSILLMTTPSQRATFLALAIIQPFLAQILTAELYTALEGGDVVQITFSFLDPEYPQKLEQQKSERPPSSLQQLKEDTEQFFLPELKLAVVEYLIYLLRAQNYREVERVLERIPTLGFANSRSLQHFLVVAVQQAMERNYWGVIKILHDKCAQTPLDWMWNTQIEWITGQQSVIALVAQKISALTLIPGVQVLAGSKIVTKSEQLSPKDEELCHQLQRYHLLTVNNSHLAFAYIVPPKTKKQKYSDMVAQWIHAAQQGDVETLIKFTAYGYDHTILVKGYTAFHQAVVQAQPLAIAFLLSQATINKCTAKGETALDLLLKAQPDTDHLHAAYDRIGALLTTKLARMSKHLPEEDFSNEHTWTELLELVRAKGYVKWVAMLTSLLNNLRNSVATEKPKEVASEDDVKMSQLLANRGFLPPPKAADDEDGAETTLHTPSDMSL